MKRRYALDRSAFTLVEMMVAVGLAVIILGVVALVFGQTGKVTSLSSAKTEAMHNARVALMFMERDLRSAFLEPNGDRFCANLTGAQIDTMHSAGADLVATSDTTDEERHALDFLTVSGQGGLTGNAQVVYYVDPAGAEAPDGTGFPTLVRHGEELPGGSVPKALSEGIDLDDPAGRLQEDKIIAFGVTQFKLRFFAGNQWYDYWDSTDDAGGHSDVMYRRMPEVVEVTVTVIDDKALLGKQDNNPITIRRLIGLPDTY